MSTAKKKPPPVGDRTSTARAKAHLERLDDAKGKRLVVDLDADGHQALLSLLSAGFGASQKDVVIKALVAAKSELKKRT